MVTHPNTRLSLASDYTVGMFGVGGQDKGGEEGGEAWRRHLEESPVTFWLTGVRDNGNLELYSVPDFTLRYKYVL